MVPYVVTEPVDDHLNSILQGAHATPYVER
jgi:hypothetical protein